MSIKKRVPKTLDQCREADTISQSLWQWEKRIKTIGTVALALIVIYGLVQTVSNGVTAYQLIDGISRDEDAAVLSTVLSVLGDLVVYTLFGLLAYAFAYAVALALGAVASIVHNTHVTANLAMYTNNGFNGEKFTKDPVQKRRTRKRWKRLFLHLPMLKKM